MPTARIAVVAPSNAARGDDGAAVAAAGEWARRAAGWEVSLCDGWDARDANGAAGEPEQRAEALTAALEGFDATFCAAGGDHAHELLAHLDRGRLAAARGWFVGTSDNSMLAAALADAGVTAFCGPDLKVSLERCGPPQLGTARPLDFDYTRTEVAALFDRAGTTVRISPPTGHRVGWRRCAPGMRRGAWPR